MDESIQKHIEESLPKVGRFQWFADAMLSGCAKTGPLKSALCDGYGHACALGAYLIGIGELNPNLRVDSIDDPHFERIWTKREDEVLDAYQVAYGRHIDGDNDHSSIAREQIAARIAAL